MSHEPPPPHPNTKDQTMAKTAEQINCYPIHDGDDVLIHIMARGHLPLEHGAASRHLQCGMIELCGTDSLLGLKLSEARHEYARMVTVDGESMLVPGGKAGEGEPITVVDISEPW